MQTHLSLCPGRKLGGKNAKGMRKERKGEGEPLGDRCLSLDNPGTPASHRKAWSGPDSTLQVCESASHCHSLRPRHRSRLHRCDLQRNFSVQSLLLLHRAHALRKEHRNLRLRHQRCGAPGSRIKGSVGWRKLRKEEERGVTQSLIVMMILRGQGKGREEKGSQVPNQGKMMENDPEEKVVSAANKT